MKEAPLNPSCLLLGKPLRGAPVVADDSGRIHGAFLLKALASPPITTRGRLRRKVLLRNLSVFVLCSKTKACGRANRRGIREREPPGSRKKWSSSAPSAIVFRRETAQATGRSDRRYTLRDESHPVRLGRMVRVYPSRLCGWLGADDVQVDHDGFLTASHQDRFHWFVALGVDFLMGNVGRNVNEVAGTGFGDKFKPVAPTEAGTSPDDIKDGLQLSMVVRSGLGLRLHDHGSRPNLRGSGASVSDCRRPRHARSLRGIGIEFVRTYDADTMLLPVPSSSLAGIRCVNHGHPSQSYQPLL